MRLVTAFVVICMIALSDEMPEYTACKLKQVWWFS
jgi:hypothetical protein